MATDTRNPSNFPYSSVKNLSVTDDITQFEITATELREFYTDIMTDPTLTTPERLTIGIKLEARLQNLRGAYELLGTPDHERDYFPLVQTIDLHLAAPSSKLRLVK